MNIKERMNELAQAGYDKDTAIAKIKQDRAVELMSGMVSADLALTVAEDEDGVFHDLYADEIDEYSEFVKELEMVVI
jgi:hypothetical protein